MWEAVGNIFRSSPYNGEKKQNLTNKITFFCKKNFDKTSPAGLLLLIYARKPGQTYKKIKINLPAKSAGNNCRLKAKVV